MVMGIIAFSGINNNLMHLKLLPWVLDLRLLHCVLVDPSLLL